MPITSARITVSGTRQMLVAPNQMAQWVSVKNERSGQEPASAVYLGDVTVTTGNGYHLGSDEVWQGYIGPDDSLYGVTGGTEEPVTVLIVRQD